MKLHRVFAIILAFPICGLIFASFMVVGCTLPPELAVTPSVPGSTSAAPSFIYTLEQEDSSKGKTLPLSIEKKPGGFQFKLVFTAGGDAYTRAVLSTANDKLVVQLTNDGGPVNNMIVNYQLGGTVNDLPPGVYQFQIIGDSNRILAQQEVNTSP